jgi:transposase
MDGTRPKRQVTLSPEARERLEAITRNGFSSAKKILHARILLLADQDHPNGRYRDVQIAQALGVHKNTVATVRRIFVQSGEQTALQRKPRATPPVPPKLDGNAEAALVAICCSEPPAGRTHWTMQLLADELVSRKIVVSISDEAVRRRLKKTGCSPGKSSVSASPRKTPPGLSRPWNRFWMSTQSRSIPMSR